MVYWLCLAVFIGSVVWSIIDDGWLDAPIWLACVFGIAVFIMTPFVISNNCCLDAKVDKKLAERDVLVYQLDTNMYDNDNDLGKKELMDDIREWNSDIAYRKSAQDNFWTGIFIPNIYDQVDLIKLVN